MYINPRAKLYQHLDRIAALTTDTKQPPVNVEIDLSNRCNDGCKWCHFAHTHTRGPLAHKRSVTTGDLMDTELALAIIYQLHQYGVRSLVWSGGGEPTLHPDFDRIVSACKLPMGMYTNGTLITPHRAELLKARLAWVYVSLDAATGDEYAAAKGVTPNQFDRAVQGIRELVRAPGQATVGIGFLLNAGNWRNANTMQALGQELGADYIQFRPTILYKPNAPGEIEGSTDWIPDALYTLENMHAEPGIEVDLNRFRMLREWAGHGYNTCWWSGLQTVITPDGRAWACLNKRGYEGAVLGDLNDDTFEAIWQRAPIQAVNGSCRVMCRGHIPNTELSAMREPRAHGEFI